MKPAPTPNLVTISAYSRLCKVTRQAIQHRILNKTLTTEEHEGRKYVDIEQYPPGKIPLGRPKWKKETK